MPATILHLPSDHSRDEERAARNLAALSVYRARERALPFDQRDMLQAERLRKLAERNSYTVAIWEAATDEGSAVLLEGGSASLAYQAGCAAMCAGNGPMCGWAP